MPIGKEDLVSFATEPYRGSVRTQQVIMREVARSSPDVFHEAAQSLGAKATPAATSMPKLLDTYKEVIKKNDIGKAVFEVNGALVRGSIAAATILATPTGVGAVALGGANWVVNKSLDEATKALDEGARRGARSILFHQLKKATDGTRVNLQSFKGKSPKEVFEQLAG
jgi:hypothetical protein